MKKVFLGIMAFALLIPQMTLAKENSDFVYEKLAETVKYYKTIENINQQFSMQSLNTLSETVEISKEEYDSIKSENGINGSGSTETTYKKLTTTISSNGSKYRYSATLNWKTFPSTRSYDVIAIGNLSNVKYSSNLNFSQYYCTTSGACRTLTSYYSKISSSGAGAAFKLPTGNLSVLTQSISFDVEKNTSASIISQSAYGDYSHATSEVTSSQAQNYNIGTSGIVFTNGVGNYYDDIMPAIATWSGSW